MNVKVDLTGFIYAHGETVLLLLLLQLYIVVLENEYSSWHLEFCINFFQFWKIKETRNNDKTMKKHDHKPT